MSSRNSGCWTCRARRKKCGEERPACATCSGLHLPCHGYGPRPEWMDGSLKEREKAQAFKSVVRKTMRIKQRQPTDGRQRASSMQEYETRNDFYPSLREQRISPEPILDTINVSRRPVPSRAHTATNPPSMTISLPPINMTTDGQMISPISMPRSSCGGLADFNSSEEDEMQTSDDLFQFDSLSDIFEFNSPAPLAEERLDTFTAPEAEYGEQDMFSPPNESSNRGDECYQAGYFDASHTADTNSTHDLLKTLKLDERKAFYSYLDTAISPLFPLAPPDLICLIRDQLQQLANESKVALSAILSPAIHWRRAQLQPYGLSDGMSSQAAEMRKEAEIPEIHENGVLAWLHQMQLAYNMAGTITYNEKSMELAQICLLQLLLSYDMQDRDWCRVLALASNLPADLFPHLLNESGPAGTYSCFSLIWIELLNCSYTNRTPSFSQKMKDLILKKDNKLPVQQITGCQREVVSLLAQIAFLKSWKDENQHGGTLSIPELVKTGISLDQELQQIKEVNTTRLSTNADLSSSEETLCVISNIYASAARVYLHVVLSGEHPNVAEIKSAVSSTIESLKKLPSGQLLKTLAWPVLMCSSLAGPEHWPFFETLEQGLMTDCVGNKRVLQALRMSRECYRLRSSENLGQVGSGWEAASKTMANVPLIF